MYQFIYLINLLIKWKKFLDLQIFMYVTERVNNAPQSFLLKLLYSVTILWITLSIGGD